MLITRRSIYSGIVHTKDLPVTPEEIEKFEENEINAQDLWPNLPPDDREFIMTGITGEEWAKMFPPEQDDDEPQTP